MPITTTTILPPPVQAMYSAKLLSVPTPNLIYNLAADKKELDARSGNTLRMRRYNALNTALVPLGPTGETPPGQTMTAVDIDAKMDYYGDYVILNEQVTLTNQDPVLNETTKRLGVAMRQSEDELTRDMLAASAGFINCVGGVNGDNPTEVTRADVDEVTRTLLDNDAFTLMDNIEGEDKFGTGPVRAAFLALCSTNLSANLDRIDGFVNVAQYPTQTNVLRSEWGAAGNLRFLISSIGSKIDNASANNANVYNITCLGMEAYAVIEQNNYSSSFIYRPPMYSSPLALNASLGYKFAQVPRITNDLWVVNLRATLR